MCSHEILTNITGFEDVFLWKPTITESFRQTRWNNETFLNNVRGERMVVSAFVCSNFFKNYSALFWCCCRCGLVVLENYTTGKCTLNSNILRHIFHRQDQQNGAAADPLVANSAVWLTYFLLSSCEGLLDCSRASSRLNQFKCGFLAHNQFIYREPHIQEHILIYASLNWG